MKIKLTMIILIVGFLCAEAQTWSWSEDYLNYGRSGLSATVMDGSIYYSGGKIDEYHNFSNIIEIYNIEEDEWDAYVPETPGRWQSSAVSANGMVFFAGGNDFNPSGFDYYTEIDVYDKDENEWTVNYLSAPRAWMGAVAHGNKLYFAGGANFNGYSNIIDIYNTETDDWDTNYLSVSRGGIGAVVAGDKLFFAGGIKGTNLVTDVVDIYDVNNDEWTTEYLSEARAFTAAVAYKDSLVYFAGGAVQNNNTSSVTIDIYNVVGGYWEDPIYLSAPRIVTALNVYDALIFTGTADYINLNPLFWGPENGIVEIYYPETGEWDLLVPDLNPPRHFYASIAYENMAYYAGGCPDSGISNKISILGYETPCLPEGITFSSQDEIDNFQINYPNCTTIEGNVEICGNDITNLNGLNVITSIDSSLIIGLDTETLVNPNLTSLSGLENLISVGKNLEIYNNEVLASLAGIENLTSIEGSLIIGLITSVGMPYPGSIYHGNPSLTSLTALDNLTSIGNELIILANPALTSLEGLNNVTSVGGELRIIGNASLTNLTGLEGLTSFEGGFIVIDNTSLISLAGLEELTSIVGDFSIGGNDALTSLTGLENLVSIDGSLNIGYIWKFNGGGNPLLSNLSVLNNLTTISGGLLIYDNEVLTSLTGLGNLTSFEGGLWINHNNALTSLTGLENLTSIGESLVIYNNNALTSLTGLENIESASISEIEIIENPYLSTCAVQSICDYISAPGANILIYDNATGCNSQEEVEAACDTVSVQETKFNEQFTIAPNPLNSTTMIQYTLPQNSPVVLKILEVSGHDIITLVNEVQQQGEQRREFNTSGLPAGVYFCVLKTNEGMQTRKIIKL